MHPPRRFAAHDPLRRGDACGDAHGDVEVVARKVIEQREGGQCKGQCNGKPPLVPFSAELKMLRYLQERVNKTTKEFDGRAPEAKNTAESDAMSKKQARVQELMRRLAEKMAKEESGDGQ